MRAVGESIDDDPARLAEVRARRQLLRELGRKYGETLGDVLRYAADAEARLAELQSHDARVAELEQQRSRSVEAVAAAQTKVGRARRRAAPKLAAGVEEHLRLLAMPAAKRSAPVSAASPCTWTSVSPSRPSKLWWISKVTGATNRLGIARVLVTPSKPGIVLIKPTAKKGCTSQRIGAVGAFTPPVTG